MEPYADFLKGNHFWLESGKQPLSGALSEEAGFRFQIYKCRITECGLCHVSTKLALYQHPILLSPLKHTPGVFAQRLMWQKCVEIVSQRTRRLPTWSLLNLNFKSELVLGSSRPEQDSDGQRQRQDSRVRKSDSTFHINQSEDFLLPFWLIRGLISSEIPVRGWLAVREVSAALSGSSSDLSSMSRN